MRKWKQQTKSSQIKLKSSKNNKIRNEILLYVLSEYLRNNKDYVYQNVCRKVCEIKNKFRDMSENEN